jgi:hypothetical protein
MNRHFKDALYYLRRAGEHAKVGMSEELDPVEERLRELTGREKEPAPGRLEKIQAELREIEKRAEGESKRAVREARERLRRYRGEEEAEVSA